MYEMKMARLIKKLDNQLKSVFKIDDFFTSNKVVVLYLYVACGSLLSLIYSERFDFGSVNGVDTKSYLCWPHFQNCNSLFFLNSLPDSYERALFYVLLFTILLLSLFFAWKKKWDL